MSNRNLKSNTKYCLHQQKKKNGKFIYESNETYIKTIF